VVEDLLLELLQLAPGLEAELGVECASRVLVGLERFGLPAGGRGRA
jgi:hypothetical protein